MHWGFLNRFRLPMLATVFVFIITACGPSAQPAATITPTPTSAPSSTPEPTATPQPVLATSIMDIVGVWEHPLPGSLVFREIREDGTMTSAAGVKENIDEQPHSLGKSWFEGNRFMVEIIDTVLPDYKKCIGVVGIYEVQLLADGGLRFVVIEDACPTRARATLAGDWMPAE
jgi:hypothetical protein